MMGKKFVKLDHAIVTVCFLLLVCPVRQSCAQPGAPPFLLIEQIDIDRIYSKILAGQEPWYSQYQLVAAEADSAFEFPYLWDDEKIMVYDWAEYKEKADLGGRRMASLALAYLYSKDAGTGAKLHNHVLGWCNSGKLTLIDQYFTNWNHSHPVATLTIVIALSYDLNASSGLFSSSDSTQIMNFLKEAIVFIKKRHDLNLYWSNQKAWNLAAMTLAGLLVGNNALVDYCVNNPANPRGVIELIDQIIDADGRICDFWLGCYDIWHSLLTLNAFAIIAAAASENGYPNLFETQAKLLLSFDFFAPLFQTNDAASLGPGFSLGDPPKYSYLYFAGIYEIAKACLPDHEIFAQVLTDPDLSLGNGRLCRAYLSGDTCSACSRWIKFPLLLWGQEIGYARITAKVYLQGFYSSQGFMHAQLHINDDLPQLSPYANAPRYVTARPDSVVDWVRVALVDQNNAMVAQTAAFLHQNGDLKDIDGSSGVSFEVVPGDYHLVVSHRNHLAVRSAQSCLVTLSDTAGWDLTTEAAQFQDQRAVVEAEPGIWAVRSGDIDQDGQVTTTDFVVWYHQFLSSPVGYESSDLSGDGEISLQDYLLWQSNARAGAGSAID